MAIGLTAAACDAIAAHFNAIANLTAYRGWREHPFQADLSGGGELAVVPGPVVYSRCPARQVDETVTAPNTLVTYRIAWLRMTGQLDLWAPYRTTRDDLTQFIEAASTPHVPRSTDLRLESTGYFGRPLTIRLQALTPEDSAGNTTRGTFRQTWQMIVDTDLVAQATHPQQLQIDAEISTALDGVTITETTTLTP